MNVEDVVYGNPPKLISSLMMIGFMLLILMEQIINIKGSKGIL